MKGQEVCAFHGGSSPQARAKAAERIAAEEARVGAEAAVAMFGLRSDVSPSQALIDELQWTAAHVAYLRSKVIAAGEERLVMGVSKVVNDGGTDEKPGNKTTTIQAGPSVWYQLWIREREHLVKVAAAAVKAGIEQRRIELAEQQAFLVAGVVRRILDGMLGALLEKGFDVRDFWDVWAREIVPREFRALEAAGADRG